MLHVYVYPLVTNATIRQTHHVQQQVDGFSVLDLHPVYVLSQLKQRGGGHLRNDKKLKADASNDWSAGLDLGRARRFTVS